MDEVATVIAQVGVPAGLGIIIVWYLIKVIIPKQMETIDKQADRFKDALMGQQQLFDQSLRLEQQVHREMLGIVVDELRAQSAATRETLNSLNRTTGEMSAVVHKLYGRMEGVCPPDDS